MFDQDNILKSPAEVARDPNANAPLRLVLDVPHQARLAKLRTVTLLCAVLVIAAGFFIYGWAYFGPNKNNPSFWHISLVSLLFWLSITQGMVALSALLRVTHASWRYPLNRVLDMASLFGLWVPLLLPLLVLVRRQIYALGVTDPSNSVWRVAGSTLWDALAVGTAYIAGLLLLFLTSLPDFARLRDSAEGGSKEQHFYQRIARVWRGVPWTGAEHQWRVLRRAEGVLIVGILASFVGSQTVLGWDFQLAAARNWDSSIFAPLFTIGSLLGALAMATLVMTVVNRFLHESGFFNQSHYDSLGRFMIALGMIWFYFRFCDFLTAWYGHMPEEWVVQVDRLTWGNYLAAVMLLGCFIAPVFGNMIHRIRTSVAGLCTVSILVLTGLAVQRYLDTVPTFAPKYPESALIPTAPGLIVFAGLAALFVLTYLLGARYFPVMSWWGTSKERTRTAERRLGNATVTVMVEDPPVWET